MYKLTNNENIIRLSDKATIPMSEENGDYKNYLKWVEEGNTPEPADIIPVPVPQIISRFQAKAVLLQMELLDDVETLMTSASPIVKLAWENAIEFNRQSPSLLVMASALGLSSEQLDALFIEASKVVV